MSANNHDPMLVAVMRLTAAVRGLTMYTADTPTRMHIFGILREVQDQIDRASVVPSAGMTAYMCGECGCETGNQSPCPNCGSKEGSIPRSVSSGTEEDVPDEFLGQLFCNHTWKVGSHDQMQFCVRCGVDRDLVEHPPHPVPVSPDVSVERIRKVMGTPAWDDARRRAFEDARDTYNDEGGDGWVDKHGPAPLIEALLSVWDSGVEFGMASSPDAGIDVFLEHAETALGEAVTLLERFRDDMPAYERGVLGRIKQTWDVTHNRVEASRHKAGYAALTPIEREQGLGDDPRYRWASMEHKEDTDG